MRTLVAPLLASLAVAGCGAPEDASPDRDPGQEGGGGAAEPAVIEPVRCPRAAANCRSATGRIVHVEAVDPDGDGDAHFVLVGAGDVTAPGISVIDVSRELRPRPLPGPGDVISAAGPVYPGSYGQRQIQATEVRVAPGDRSR